jgi:hypothetical protein
MQVLNKYYAGIFLQMAWRSHLGQGSRQTTEEQQSTHRPRELIQIIQRNRIERSAHRGCVCPAFANAAQLTGGLSTFAAG